MKRTVFSIFLLFAGLLLSACFGSEAIASYEVAVECTVEACDIAVTNMTDQSYDYGVEMFIEPEGTVIGEDLQHPNSDAPRHIRWRINYQRVFSHTDTIADGETESYTIELGDKAVGQTLVKIRVTGNREVHEEYALIEAEKPVYDEPVPMVNSLDCSGGILTARTDLEPDTGEKHVGLYFNHDLEHPVTTMTVADGSYGKIQMPIPDDVEFIHMAQVGHKDTNVYATIPEPHMYRVYCIPGQ